MGAVAVGPAPRRGDARRQLGRSPGRGGVCGKNDTLDGSRSMHDIACDGDDSAATRRTRPEPRGLGAPIAGESALRGGARAGRADLAEHRHRTADRRRARDDGGRALAAGARGANGQRMSANELADGVSLGPTAGRAFAEGLPITDITDANGLATIHESGTATSCGREVAAKTGKALKSHKCRRHTRCYQLAFRRALALDAERERAEAELARRGRSRP